MQKMISCRLRDGFDVRKARPIGFELRTLIAWLKKLIVDTIACNGVAGFAKGFKLCPTFKIHVVKSGKVLYLYKYRRIKPLMRLIVL